MHQGSCFWMASQLVPNYDIQQILEKYKWTSFALPLCSLPHRNDFCGNPQKCLWTQLWLLFLPLFSYRTELIFYNSWWIPSLQSTPLKRHNCIKVNIWMPPLKSGTSGCSAELARLEVNPLAECEDFFFFLKPVWPSGVGIPSQSRSFLR